MPNIGPVPILIFVVGWLYVFFKQYDMIRKVEKMYALLADKFPGYYEKIGKPIYFGFNLSRSSRGRNYLMDLTYKGIPEDFPKHKGARAIATQIKKQSRRLLLVVAIMMIDVLIAVTVFHVGLN